jgi:hypothetical protein
MSRGRDAPAFVFGRLPVRNPKTQVENQTWGTRALEGTSFYVAVDRRNGVLINHECGRTEHSDFDRATGRRIAAITLAAQRRSSDCKTKSAPPLQKPNPQG